MIKLFSEKVDFTFTSSDLNILTVENFEEIFFDVFEFEINGNKYIAEKTNTYKGFPVVTIPVVERNKKFEAPFVLQKGKFTVLYNNKNSTFIDHDHSITEEEIVLPELDEVVEDSIILVDNKADILDEINRAKQLAIHEARQQQRLAAEKTLEEIKANKALIQEQIEVVKDDLIQEFYKRSVDLKEEIDIYSDSITLNIQESLEKSLTDRLSNLHEAVKDSVSKTKATLCEEVKDLTTKLVSNIGELHTANKEESKQLVIDQIEFITSNVNTLLDSRVKDVEGSFLKQIELYKQDLLALEKANVELNDKAQTGIGKALGRIGNLKTAVGLLNEKVDTKIESVDVKIREYYDSKLNDIEENVANITVEQKECFINLLEESKTNLLKEIHKIGDDTKQAIAENSPVTHYIVEGVKDGKDFKIDTAKLKKEFEKSINDKFSKEVSSLKRLIELSSGGGSVAKQFANGGTMNGDLNVTGSILSGGVNLLDIFNGGGSGGGLTNPVDYIEFNTAAGITVNTGQLAWNDAEGTLDIGLKGGSVHLPIGQTEVIRVVNDVGDDLLRSEFRAVRIREQDEGGAHGQRLSVKLAQGNSDHNSATTIGIVAEDIDNNQEGFVTTSGIVKEVDTTGAKSWNNTEDWLDGDILYLSPDHPGYLTKIKPQAPQHTVIIGWIVYKHSQHGKIFVKVDNGYEIDELHNVRIINPQNNQLLTYSDSLSVWENKTFISSENDANSIIQLSIFL